MNVITCRLEKNGKKVRVGMVVIPRKREIKHKETRK